MHNNTNEQIVFYKEWLSLDKKHFRILAMLADVGEFVGNLTDVCNYFSLKSNDKTRKRFKESIEYLAEEKLITTSKQGYTYTLNHLPQQEEIEIPRKQFERIKSHDYETESVSWQAVLKVLLWLIDFHLHTDESSNFIITNKMIADDLGISGDTVTASTNVLSKEYEGMMKQTVKELRESEEGMQFRTLGQITELTAWWKE